MRSNNTNNAKESSAAFLLSASFLKRTLTVLVLVPLSIWLLAKGDPYSTGLFLVVFVGLLIEWSLLIRKTAFSTIRKVLWDVGGTIYIIAGVVGLYHFYNQKFTYFMIMLVVIWATDIGAYFVGQVVGGPKLWPRVSPKKTWSGTIGGTLAALIVVLVANQIEGMRATPIFNLCFFIGLSIVGQIGDLIESAVKRHFDVKDSGTLLPGHGGLLDRFDSTLAIGIVLSIVFFYK
jgi:phosphatidate cytidylyltransferase